MPEAGRALLDNFGEGNLRDFRGEQIKEIQSLSGLQSAI
jgi:hypothetical protein